MRRSCNALGSDQLLLRVDSSRQRFNAHSSCCLCAGPLVPPYSNAPIPRKTLRTTLFGLHLVTMNSGYFCRRIIEYIRNKQLLSPIYPLGYEWPSMHFRCKMCLMEDPLHARYPHLGIATIKSILICFDRSPWRRPSSKLVLVFISRTYVLNPFFSRFVLGLHLILLFISLIAKIILPHLQVLVFLPI